MIKTTLCAIIVLTSTVGGLSAYADSDYVGHWALTLPNGGPGWLGITQEDGALQAAILLAKFQIFPDEILLRQKVAKRYTDLLEASDVELITPHVPLEYESVWAQYSILAQDEEHRKILQNNLETQGIPTAIYYPKPLHMQTAYSTLGYREGDFPVSERTSKRIFSLPMHPYLQEKDQKRIVKALNQMHG